LEIFNAVGDTLAVVTVRESQIYSWWSLYARLVDRERHREAVTTRHELLGDVARQTRHAGQTRLSVNLSHAKSAKIKTQLAEASAFLQSLLTTAEQLTNTQRWERSTSKPWHRSHKTSSQPVEI
jgi:hypothetical protein